MRAILQARRLLSRAALEPAASSSLEALVHRPPPGGRGTSAAASASFESIGLMPELAASLRSLGFVRPSDPQVLAVPPLLTGESIAFASSTGSGKTLAYLLPTMQQLREQELANPGLRGRPGGHPRALVLAPTRDLAAQIGEVAKAIAHHFRLRVRTAEGGTAVKDTKRRLVETGADLLVATPSRLLRLHAMGAVSLRQVRHVIIDEADDILLRGFDQELDQVISACHPRPTSGPPTNLDSTRLDSTRLDSTRLDSTRLDPYGPRTAPPCAYPPVYSYSTPGAWPLPAAPRPAGARAPAAGLHLRDARWRRTAPDPA